MGTTEDSKALMWRITNEIWNEGRLELIDELIAEDLVDHVETPGLEGSGRSRYRASVEMARAAFRPRIILNTFRRVPKNGYRNMSTANIIRLVHARWC